MAQLCCDSEGLGFRAYSWTDDALTAQSLRCPLLGSPAAVATLVGVVQLCCPTHPNAVIAATMCFGVVQLCCPTPRIPVIAATMC